MRPQSRQLAAWSARPGALRTPAAHVFAHAHVYYTYAAHVISLVGHTGQWVEGSAWVAMTTVLDDDMVHVIKRTLRSLRS